MDAPRRVRFGSQPYRPGPDGLGFSFSDLIPNLTSSWKDQLKNLLSDAQSKLEAKIGVFLTTGEVIRDAKARAQQQQNSPKADVKAQATALVAKANGLLTQYDAIKSQAGAALSHITDLKNQFQTNDVLKMDNPMNMGTRIVELFTQKKAEISAAATEATQLAVRIQGHINDTQALVSDVKNLEDYAAGKGTSAFLNKIGGSVTDSVIGPVAKIAAVGLLAYLLLPSLLGRSLRSVTSR